MRTLAPAPAPTVQTTMATPRHQARVTARGIALGEWIKLRSVRSTVVTLIGGAAATVFFAVVFSATAGSEAAPGPGATLTDPVALSLGAITLTQLIIGVVGVLVVAGEYATGLIRTTFAATGSRLGVLAAKAGVVGSVVFALMAVASTLAVVVGQRFYAGSEATVAITDPDLLRVVLGATTYVTGVALVGVALGFVLRSTSGAIGILVGGLFIGPNLLSLLPDGFTDAVLRYLPSKAGESMMAMKPDADLLSVGAAFAVLGLWVAGLLGLAAWRLVRTDA